MSWRIAVEAVVRAGPVLLVVATAALGLSAADMAGACRALGVAVEAAEAAADGSSGS